MKNVIMGTKNKENTMMNIILETKKKAFTLIELLIVVAIIGILAGVGVPMYNGYMASARVESATTNHSTIRGFMASTITNCATGRTNAQLGGTAVLCTSTPAQWAAAFTVYFNNLNDNPYGTAQSAITSTSTGPLDPGLSVISSGAGPNRLTVITNTGPNPETGVDVYMPGGTAVDTIFM